MTETSYARSRRAALFGLTLQLLAAGAAFGLSRALGSMAAQQLAWYLLGGLPIWFITVLIYRQHELAELEAMDLETLRRQKQAGGVGEAIFGEEGNGLGFRVAQARLQWMQRWLVPAFGLLAAVYLAGVGLWRFRTLSLGIKQPGWAPLANVPIGLVILTLLMLLLFLYSRYASGMGRVAEWQYLRASGSYMLGNALAAIAVLVCLGIYLYAGVATWEHALAYVFPVVMVLLAAETLLNFVLDIYRPRAPGIEPRACFDSRLLALVAEPGGIASTIAEAINYQFGFQVSQTWFYQLLQRAFVPLAAVGVLALWSLSCLVVVHPYEHAIIERFGRQVNADSPYGPGLYAKLPWPFEVARKYNTGQLHQIVIGHSSDVEEHAYEREHEQELGVELWTDAEHVGAEHYNFLVAPPRAKEEDSAPRRAARDELGKPETPSGAPVHIMRMKVAIQYKILPTKLASYTRSLVNPHEAIRDIAWREVIRLNASADANSLLGDLRSKAGEILMERIAEQVDQLGLGLEVAYVGLLGVHPDQTVAKAFREVISAGQEKIAEIRRALKSENATLSRVAGEPGRARGLIYTLDRMNQYIAQRDNSRRMLRDANLVLSEHAARFDPLKSLYTARIAARWDLDVARREHERIEEESELGLGGSLRERADAALRVEQAARTEKNAAAELDRALRPVLQELSRALDERTAEEVARAVEAELSLAYLNARLEKLLQRMEGEAAVTLAQALADRWQNEMQAAGQVARLMNEREAFAAAPEIFKARRYLEVLAEGMKGARKYFLALDPGERSVHMRIEAQEEAGVADTALPARVEQ